MPQKEIKPFPIEPNDFDRIEEEIISVLRKEFYLPLVEEMDSPKQILKNSLEDLKDAIATGQITYDRGYFSGRYSSQISREIKRLGGKFQKGKWFILRSQLPVDIINAIASSSSRFESVLQKIDAKLQRYLPEQIAEKVKLERLFDKAIWKTEDKIQKTLKNITVTPKLTPERREIIARDYTNNLRLYIKDWAASEIVTLRKEMQKHVMSGGRYEDLVKTIQKSYEVGKNKAKFLARQETSLLMTKFKEIRYTEAGSKEYRWKCVVGSPRHPVRPLHKVHNGKVFNWDKPPITSPNGARNNPGQDYNCRCVAIPIVRF